MNWKASGRKRIDADNINFCLSECVGTADDECDPQDQLPRLATPLGEVLVNAVERPVMIFVPDTPGLVVRFGNFVGHNQG
jgi:hypothetical protein